MGRSGFPIKLFVFAGLVGIGAGALALSSRLLWCVELRQMFRTAGLGQPSLIEHWLSGMSAVALFVFLVAVISHFSKRVPFRKTWLRKYWFVTFRKKALNAFRAVYITHWATVAAMLYIGGSLSWELGQMHQSGVFQSDQFFMDILGSLGFCVLLWLLINAEYKRAREIRRSYLA